MNGENFKVGRRPLKTLESRARELVKAVERTAPIGGYVTYVIRAPIQVDESCGRPFYVGQTSDLARRVRSHLLLAARRINPNKPVHKRIYECFLRDQLPSFEVLEVRDSLLESLRSETQWVQYFRSQKFDLANVWSEHRGDGGGGSTVPEKRLLQFTISQAVQSNLRLTLHCRACGINEKIQLDQSASATGALKLRELKQHIRCPQCGKSNCLRIKQPAPDDPSF